MVGTNIRAAKLTPNQVIEIRRRYNAGESQRELCRAFGVSVNTIGRIVRGETWQTFGGPGKHVGATGGRGVDYELIEEGLQRAARENAPADDAPEIQASLARLARMLENEPAREKPVAVPDSVCTCPGQEHMVDAPGCPASVRND